LERKSAYNRNE